jgi:protein-tyrosine-phosphatase
MEHSTHPEQAGQTGQTGQQPLILIVGGADTGRSPITVALLRHKLSQYNLPWLVTSAGVTGHDDDPAEPEARDAIATFGLNIDEHRARSLDDDMVAAATVLIAIDSGTLHVLRARYPAAADWTVMLSDLADSRRDIPDLFRMQMGAWVSYAREIESMLSKGLERLISLVEAQLPASPEPPAAPAPTDPQAHAAQERSDILQRCDRMLGVLSDMPTLIDWSQARSQFTQDIQAASVILLTPDDLAHVYAETLITYLDSCQTVPNQEQIALLRAALQRLTGPVDQQAISELSANLKG